MACYLLQTWNDYLTTVGTDVLIQIKPLPLLSAGLENKACDRRALSFRKGPLQNNTRWALISWQQHRGLQFTSPQRRIWCRGNKKDLQSISRIHSGGKIKLQRGWRLGCGTDPATDVQPWECDGSPAWGFSEEVAIYSLKSRFFGLGNANVCFICHISSGVIYPNAFFGDNNFGYYLAHHFSSR